jgi:Sulfotransferase domain
MLYGVKKVVKYALGTDVAGRGIAVRPSDTFLVSYPRSGNTWTRFLIANLIYPDKNVSFTNIERLIPDCEAHSSRYMKRIPGPRIIKSHEYFDHRYRRVIYIVRDPRDVVLSYYNFQRKYRQIQDDYPLAQYVSDFVAGRLSSADWGTWGENVGSWLVRDGEPGFLLVRYQDLKSDPARELSRIAGLLKIEATAPTVATAIERSSADRMREMERAQGSEWVATKNRRQDIPFVGTASSGGWKSRLPIESVAEIEAAWGHWMKRIGYALVTCSDARAIATGRATLQESTNSISSTARDGVAVAPFGQELTRLKATALPVVP